MDMEDLTERADLTEAEEFAVASFQDEQDELESSEAQDMRAADLELAAGADAYEPGSAVMVLEEVDVALVLPVWEPTGDAQVDAALEQLATLDELSVHDHAELLSSVHSSLHQRLTDISA